MARQPLCAYTVAVNRAQAAVAHMICSRVIQYLFGPEAPRFFFGKAAQKFFSEAEAQIFLEPDEFQPLIRSYRRV